MDKREFGVVQRLEVEGDRPAILQLACRIAAFEHNRAVGMSVVVGKDGVNALRLHWTMANDVTPLPIPLEGGDEMAEFAQKWLKRCGEYPRAPDTDGDAVQGFHVTNNGNTWWGMLTITPCWIVYGK